jgi:hypothetical protein
MKKTTIYDKLISMLLKKQRTFIHATIKEENSNISEKPVEDDKAHQINKLVNETLEEVSEETSEDELEEDINIKIKDKESSITENIIEKLENLTGKKVILK